jgi:GNAT superfamily N-acetyltransferase
MELRPWRTGDELLAAAASPFFSSASLTNRFLAGTGGRLPSGYLRHIATGPRDVWDAQVAAGDDMLYGWAEFGRLPGVAAEADLAILVADPWHRQGIATALIRALLPRAAAAGVTMLNADVLPSNRAAHALLRSIFGQPLRPAFVGGNAHYSVPVELPVLVGLPG